MAVSKKNTQTDTSPDIVTEPIYPSGEQIEIQLMNVAGDLNDGVMQTDVAAESNLPTAQPIISEQMARTILQAPFAVAAAQWGDYWLLSDGELDLMGPSASVVFSELFGRYVDDHPEAYMLCFTLLACVGSRAAILISDKNAQKRSENVLPVPDMQEVEQQ